MPASPDINAGAWYLRGRSDHGWDVCEPITGEVLAEIAVDPETHEITASGERSAALAGSEAVRRYLQATWNCSP
jgi:hypothetical protein